MARVNVEVGRTASDMAETLTPWREVMTPHPDVRAGRYQQAEFAADLAQVLAGTATAEYGDAVEFFRRTYLTAGMKRLLTGAIERLRGEGGEPVIQLKTAFGGGKTHTMLALYHLLREPGRCAEVPAVAELLAESGGAPPAARVAVLVGTALDPQRARAVPEGSEIGTLWGEMAYQLAGQRGFDLVAEADFGGTAPGSNTLVDLFEVAGPCVILIDELVAFIRNIKDAKGKPRSGSFNANLTFVQNLTEAVKRTPHALLVASIPESRIELGDASGEEVARRIENTFGRLEAVWQPVAVSESFEVVRRRLFGDLADTKARERTVEAFGRLYRTNASDFPAECREAAYEQQIRASYPIHPEVFERLYDDWSSMERFQRTRGVLRLMAVVISVLWEAGDRSPLIMPGSLPLADARVRQELTRYLGDAWNAVVDSDVDGAHAASGAVDSAIPRMGQVQACRRVARTVLLGSVPTKATRGIEDNRIKLGCVQPGEQIAVYADALGRLRETLTYLYSSGSGGRYWFGVQPNLNRTVADRAGKLEDADVWAELERRMRQWKMGAGVEFAGVHLAPQRPEDVPDEDRARLVVLAPRVGHRKTNEESAAVALARAMLDSRGAAPRRYRNMLLFLAADSDALETLMGETRRLLAWQSVQRDVASLNLDKGQVEQCAQAIANGESAVTQQLENAYVWLLAPAQEEAIMPPGVPTQIDATRLSSGNDLSSLGTVLQRASYRAVTDNHLITRWGPKLLQLDLQRFILWQGGEHLSVRQLWQYLASYLYLPRLKDKEVLLATIRAGAAATDFFGYAMGVDGSGQYQGLYFGRQPATVFDEAGSLIVTPEAARAALARQAERAGAPAEAVDVGAGQLWDGATATGASAAARAAAGGAVMREGNGASAYSPAAGQPGAAPAATANATPTAPTAFFGSVELDPLLLSSAAGQVGQAVIQHLAGLLGAEVKVRLEIEAHIPGGVPDKAQRDVTENARTLKFRTAEFE
jgi:predicted AAA+ superfamily ATPase